MSRLAAVEKGLYYPTDTRVIKLLVEHHLKAAPYTDGSLHIADPCAGEGVAVHTVAEALRVKWAAATTAQYPYGDIARHLHHAAENIHVHAVELDEERATQASLLLGPKNVIHAPIENVTVTGRGFDVLWLNPPYDQVASGRAELAWVRMCAPFLRRNASATMLLVVPDMFVGEGRYKDRMQNALYSAGFAGSTVLKFPEPEYQQFKQVVIIAAMPYSANDKYSHRYHNLSQIAGVIGECRDEHGIRICADGPNDAPGFELATREAVKPSLFADGVPPILYDLLGKPGDAFISMRPLMEMRPEHAAMVAAAGMFNGAVIGDKAFKGSTVKRTQSKTSTSVTDAGSKVTETVTVEILAAQLTSIDLKTGDLMQVNSVDDKELFEVVLEANAEAFVNLAQTLYPPLFTSAQLWRYEDALRRVHGPRALEGHENGMFPPQALRAAAVLDCWRRNEVATVQGEMGTGKTLLSMAATTVRAALQRKAHNQKVVVLLPPKEDLVKKWGEELEVALREFNPKVVHVETITDVQKAFALDGLVFILLKETTAKISSGWRPVKPLKRKAKAQEVDICPGCGEVLILDAHGFVPPKDKEDQEPDPEKMKCRCKNCLVPVWTTTRRTQSGVIASPFSYQDFQGQIESAQQNFPGMVKSTVKTGGYFDPDDGQWVPVKYRTTEVPRWTQEMAALDNPGFARYPLAKYIRDHYRDRYLLIIDECHNVKSGDSARSYAAQDLLASAHRTIQMTGTLYNGMASSIFYLLYRALPDFRRVWAYNDVQEFVNRYGLFERITKSYEGKSSTTSAFGYEKTTERKNERPGIHPAMIALLLPTTVFFGIRDLDIVLPPYAEHTLFVDAPREFSRIEGYLNRVKSDAIARMKDGDHSLLAQWNQARLGVYDLASIGDAVDGHSMAPIHLPDGVEMWPKEEAFLRLVAQEKIAGRKVLAFVGQINRRDITGRLLFLLEQYGMKGAVLRAEESNRVAFVRRWLKQGADVILTSASLVKEGIDLLETPTIVWIAPEFNIYTVQQANRRSWRIGQTTNVDIYYMAYNETPQAYAMQRVAQKLAAAQTLQGEVRQGLAALLGETDFVTQLQKQVLEREHYESSLSLADLPPLVKKAPAQQVDVHVVVSTRATAVRVQVDVKELADFAQLSMF